MRYFYNPDTNNFKTVPEGEDPLDYGVSEDAIETAEEVMSWPHTCVDGEIVPDLDLIKDNLWEDTKKLRDTLENGVGPTDFGPVQIDDKSMIKIGSLVQSAQTVWETEVALAATEEREP